MSLKFAAISSAESRRERTVALLSLGMFYRLEGVSLDGRGFLLLSLLRQSIVVRRVSGTVDVFAGATFNIQLSVRINDSALADCVRSAVLHQQLHRCDLGD